MALLIMIFLVAPNAFNGPIGKDSETLGTVIGSEYYPVGKFDAQGALKVRIRLDSGKELLLAQTSPVAMKFGDRVRVITWRRRFLGYRTTFERE